MNHVGAVTSHYAMTDLLMMCQEDDRLLPDAVDHKLQKAKPLIRGGPLCIKDGSLLLNHGGVNCRVPKSRQANLTGVEF